MSKEEKTTIHTRRVPARIKRKFKSWCADNGYTMTEALVFLMREAYEKKRRLDL